MELSITFITQFFVLGAIIGFLTGLFGIGGGTFLVPSLLFIFQKNAMPVEIATPLALGTSLTVTFMAAINGAREHRKHQSIKYRLALSLIIPGVIGAQVGAIAATTWDPIIVQKLFGMLISLLGLYVFIFFVTEPVETVEEKSFSIKATVIGFSIGLLSTLLGIGGGTMLVPLMILFMDIPFRYAVGTSSIFMAAAALSGVIGYVYHGWQLPALPPMTVGFVHLGIVVVTTVAIFLSGRFGVMIANRAKPKVLARILAALLLFIGLRALYFT